MRAVVGFSQKIRRVWLDAALDRLAETTDEKKLRAFLNKFLKEDLPGTESRAKSIGIILRIWSGIPAERLSLRSRAVAMLPRISGQDRIWLHWGMSALAYPFFRDTAEAVGRLLALQDDFTTAQVQARMLATWGDRVTSREATQKLITTLVDWEVLRSTKTKGHFLLSRKIATPNTAIQLWLVEALLDASAADEIEAQQLLRLPELFPFALTIGITDLRRLERFNIHRQGLDMDMVALCKKKVPISQSRRAKAAQSSLFEIKGENRTDINGIHGSLTANGKDTVVEHRHSAILPSPMRFAAADSPRQAITRSSTRASILGLADECHTQYREGHFYGCIALAQSIIESHVQQAWNSQQSVGRETGAFSTQIRDLHDCGLLDSATKGALESMWTNRHMFHHLHPANDSERTALVEIARQALTLLAEIEQRLIATN